MKSFLILAPLLLAAGCAVVDGPHETKAYSLSDFDGVSASAGVNVILKQGATYSVSAEGPKNGLDTLDLRVDGKTLVVGRKNSWNFFRISTGHTTVTVTAPMFTKLDASSGADMKGDNLTLQDVKLGASSGADLELSGSCANLRVDVSSGADVESKDLKCQTADVNASSGADADVYASVSAKGRASSGGDVMVHGKPAQFDREESSGGNVKAP